MTSLRAVRLGKHAFTLAGIEPIEIGQYGLFHYQVRNAF